MWKVMIADDEAYLLEAMEKLIDWEKMGCKLVYRAKNGRDLIDHMERYHPDIVITDIKMPVLGGMEVAEYIHQHMEQTKVILLTAYADFTYAKEAIHYNVSDYIVKTSLLEELPKSIERVIAKLQKDSADLEENAPEDILGKVQVYIEDNYRKRITLTDIAKAVHANGSYLSRLYKSKTGENLFDVINRRKLDTAKEFILKGKKIYEAADLVGYDDVAYFSRVFKRYEGLSPKEFEKSINKA